jgi:hypothetical protein
MSARLPLQTGPSFGCRHALHRRRRADDFYVTAACVVSLVFLVAMLMWEQIT